MATVRNCDDQSREYLGELELSTTVQIDIRDEKNRAGPVL